MTTMSDAQILEHVKNSNLITGTYLDNMLTAKIQEVKAFLLSAGVPADVVDSDTCAGVIAIGVNDLVSPMGTGGTPKLSAYFFQRAIQLRGPVSEVTE